MNDMQCLSHTKWDCKEDMCEKELQRDAFLGTGVFCVNGRLRRRSSWVYIKEQEKEDQRIEQISLLKAS